MLSEPTRVLLVDDDVRLTDAIARYLTRSGYAVSTASDGAGGLERLQHEHPDIVVLDVMMPGMDGFEVCHRLRDDPRLAEVPVVMVTTLDDRDSRLQGLKAGADDFISKPFDWAELEARVRTIIRLNRYRRLLAERTRFEWVVEQSGEGYLLVNDEDVVLYANPQARLYLGLNGDTGPLPGSKFLPQAQNQYRCEPAEAWTPWPPPLVSPLQPSRYLVRPESATAQAGWLQVTLLDQPTGFAGQRLIQLRDVTVELNLQRDRRTFHDMLSHKLRTPLAHIATSLELLAEEEAPLSNPEMVQLSKMALKGARRLRGEIEDILRYLNVSRLAPGESGCALAEIPPLVAEIGDSLGVAPVTIAGLEGLEQIRLVLSRRAMEWILWETLENAQKFHPQQLPHVEIVIAEMNERRVSLKIADDGLTLSPDQLAQVWTPYYQGEKYFTGEAAGMGLGLPTVASLVWAVGGTVRLYNRNRGPGVVVELSIPIAQV
jgi:CheY-like chemotaxis protein